MSDDGLPLPPPPKRPAPAPAGPPRVNGITAGETSERAGDTRQWLHDHEGKYANDLAGIRSEASSAPMPIPRDSFTPIETHVGKFVDDLEHGKGLDASLGWMHIVTSPFESGTEIYQTVKIRNMEAAFVKQYGKTLDAMRDLLARKVQLAMLELARRSASAADLIRRPHRARELMDQKRMVGVDTLNAIDEQLKNPDLSPDDRSKLQAAKDDLLKWSAQERNPRVQEEDAELRRLEQLEKSVADQAATQADKLPEAAWLLGKYGGGTGWQTAYARPQAAALALSTRALLLRARIGVDTSLGGS